MDTSTFRFTLIDPIEVPATEDESFLEAWKRVQEFLREQDGNLSSILYQSLSPDADFRFVNLSEWRSPNEVRAATGQLSEHEMTVPHPSHPALYEVVREDAPAGGTAQAVVLINFFEVPPGEDETFIRSWEAARDVLRGRPGYVDTRLHRSILPSVDFRFTNVAHWESPAAFRQAVSNPAFREASRMPYTAHPALYQKL
jgi:heme-degrading monooxygenase HmoA